MLVIKSKALCTSIKIKLESNDFLVNSTYREYVFLITLILYRVSKDLKIKFKVFLTTFSILKYKFFSNYLYYKINCQIPGSSNVFGSSVYN